jgi:dCTP diphosphatase
MATYDDTLRRILKFRDDRDWKQFHPPKELAVSLMIEAGELLEHFQWKSKEEVDAYLAQHRDEVADEVADVLYYVMLLAHELGIEALPVLNAKIDKNAKKYPVEKARGSHAKYTAYRAGRPPKDG